MPGSKRTSSRSPSNHEATRARCGRCPTSISSSVIAASFFLLLVILRQEQYPLLGLARAAFGSYTIKVLSVTAFIAVREGVYGATELFLLYVVYAFGAFSLHLMTVCGFIAKTAARDKEALV